MEEDLNSLLRQKMIAYYQGDVRRINHFMKVYGFAKTIGELEHLEESTQLILEAAAVVHDIGIKPAEEKYGSSAGEYQQLEGPAPAREMLEKVGYPVQMVDRICFLVGHHHTYSAIDGLDYQILVEADFLVNLDEDKLGAKQIAAVREKIFRTESGRRLLDHLFPER